VDYDELLELAKSRRTIRVIKPDPVPDELRMGNVAHHAAVDEGDD
jgi:hypothetical protein